MVHNSNNLGLYVHLPWCISKCPYCDFNSHAIGSDALPEDAYVAALLNDLDAEYEVARTGHFARPVTSMFFGGGTPSLFSAGAIGRIIDRAARHFGLSEGCEITLEANPGAIEYGSFDDLRGAGINRISLGAQSFNDASLKRLGRVHSANETVDAVRALTKAGLDNFNLDLMYALPQQALEDALDDLTQALALGPAHLSHYQLTLEPNTLFHHQPPALPDQDTAFSMQEACGQRLAEAGFDHYEVSAFAPRGQEARHNLNYWRFGDYVGVGAGAHGKLTHTDTRTVIRTTKTRHPRAYMAAQGQHANIRTSNVVSETALHFEYPLNILRLRHDELTLEGFANATLAPAAVLKPAAERAVTRGLLSRSETGRYCKTNLGWRFLNDLQAIFLHDEANNQ